MQDGIGICPPQCDGKPLPKLRTYDSFPKVHLLCQALGEGVDQLLTFRKPATKGADCQWQEVYPLGLASRSVLLPLPVGCLFSSSH